MDSRKLESIIFSLTIEKEDLLRYLDRIDNRLNDETISKDEYADLREDREYLLEDIEDVDMDIAVYQEMLDKLSLADLETYNENTDGGYDSRYEVFTEGDY